MKNRILSAFILALEYMPSALTIALAIYASTPNMPENKAYSWILCLLALFATTSIIDRLKYFNKINVMHRLLEEKLTENISAERFFHKGINDLKDRFQEQIESATSIDICGVTSSRFVKDYLDVLEKKMNSGCNIRVILIDPESIAPEHAESKSYVTNANTYRNRVLTIISIISNLNHKKKSGTILVRKIPFDPSFGMFIVNREAANGVMACEIYQHVSIEPHPSFFLNAKFDDYWFRFYSDQYEKMWDKGKDQDLNQQCCNAKDCENSERRGKVR